MVYRQGILGVILAGGISRRMFEGSPLPGQSNAGGGDKTLLELAGRPMLAHVAERLRPQVTRLILNGNGNAARFAAFGLEVVADNTPGLGPLGGLHAAMKWMERNAPTIHTIATVAGDVPFLPSDLVSRLSAAAAEGPDAVVLATSGGRRHPTIALWSRTLLPVIERALVDGHLSLDRLARSHGAIEVHFPMRKIDGEDVDPFFNANTPADLARARRLFQDNAGSEGTHA